MMIKKFRELYKDRAVPVRLDSIVLTEHCHKKAFEKNSKISKLKSDPMCIVHANDDGTYSLIVGYRDYITAKNSGMEEISVIPVSDTSRRNFLKSLDMTFEMYELSKIHPPKGWTPPSPKKIRSCIDSYEKTGTLGKQIVISPDGTILDGYSAVCAAERLGIKSIPVYIMNLQRFQKKCKKILKTS